MNIFHRRKRSIKASLRKILEEKAGM